MPEKIKSIEWFLNGVELKPTQKHATLFNPFKGSCSLIINDINKQDAGEYSCRVVSHTGQFITKCVLNVEPGNF